LNRIVRWIFWLLVLGLVIAGAVYSLWPKPVEVDMAVVAVGPMTVTVNEDGMTRIKERYTVSSPVGGQLVRIDLDPGDPIQAGSTLLATIQPSDPNMLDARQVAESEARVSAAKKAIDRAAAVREQAVAEKELAESHVTRAHQLWEQQGIPQREYDEYVARARSAREALRAAAFDEDIAEFELQQAEAALIRAKPNADNDPQRQFEIYSPIDGNVLRVLQESATVVTPGTPLLELGNRRDLEIVIDVLSTDAVKIQPGDEVILEHWGGNLPLTAKVRTIEPAAFTKISALGVEEQRVNVIADFDGPLADSIPLGDAYRVEARIVVWRDDRALKVPSKALFRGGDQWFAYVNENGVARKTPLTIGHYNSNDTEVLSGLEEGVQVVLYPNDQLVDGVRLAPRPQ
jgi:HlyD family secretion protein